MSDQRHHADKPLAIGERRNHARTPVSPQAFVKFGENNYGFVFNISESGLVFAPTETLTLAVGAVAKMRFQLPQSKDWIETRGEIAWIADSKKEAGVRFVDLHDDTRIKIRNWIAQEPSRAQFARQRDGIPESDQSAKDGLRVPASTGTLGANTGTFVDKIALNSMLADPAKLLLETKSARGKLASQPAKVVASEPRQSAGSLHVPERRTHVRRRVLSLEYIDLGSSNGGILLNLSEGGMYVQAVASLSADDIPQIGFRLPDSGYLVKTDAQIAWVGESKKDAGIRFLNLPEEARLKIREWVAVEHPPLERPNEIETKAPPLPKKTERLLEMPPPGQFKKPAISQEIPARIPQTRDSSFAPPPVAASPDRAAPKVAELPHVSSPMLQPRGGSLVPPPVAAIPDRAAAKPPELPHVSGPMLQPRDGSLVPPPVAATPDRAAAKPLELPHVSGPGLQPRDGSLVALPIAASSDRAASKAAELLHLSGPILQRRFGEPAKISEEAADDLSSPDVAPRRSKWTLVAVIFVVVLVSFLAGWVAAGPGGRKQFLAMFERQQNNASETVQNPGATPVPAGPTANVPLAPPTSVTPQEPKQRISSTPSGTTATSTTPDKAQPRPNGNAQPLASAPRNSDILAAHNSPPQTQKPAAPTPRTNVPTTKSADASRDTRPSQPLTSTTASNSSSALAQNKTQEIRPVEQPRPVTAPTVSNFAVKSTPPPATSNASSQPSASTSATEKPNASPVVTQPAHVEPSPVAAKPPEPVEVVKGTVTVSASPFPSIRVPPEMKSQISKQGASLQMGQLLSRVEPVYPEDAERQRIEGVVKLHMIIDRDGNIQDVDKMTGPPLLVAAAANAVRQWRYKPTSLGGQPVEAGVDVTVTFRLQTTHAN
jgi:TonB family protein